MNHFTPDRDLQTQNVSSARHNNIATCKPQPPSLASVLPRATLISRCEATSFRPVAPQIYVALFILIDMSASPATPSSARTPRLSHMRSQRIVHIVQTEKDDTSSVSVVTLSENGHAEETQETVDFCSQKYERNRRTSRAESIDDEWESSEEETGDPILFEVDLEDTSAPQLTPHNDKGIQWDTRVRKASLFSNDEFEPIRMKLPKRTPQPLRLSAYSDKRYQVADASSPSGSPSPSASCGSDHSAPGDKNNLSHMQRSTDSSSTLFLVDSATSSTTCVDEAFHHRTEGRVFCAYEKGGNTSPKHVEVVTPDSVTGTRGLVDLHLYGYNFGWSRFAGRRDAVHGLSPEDAAELEVFLSKGPDAFPARALQKHGQKKSVFEKKLSDVFKLLK